MKANFEACLKITLAWEGGYSNHPDDPGGPTQKGIIQREYTAWLKKHGRAPGNVRGILDADVRGIYKTEYWDACHCDDIESGVDLCVFDAAVNSGVGRASIWRARVPAEDRGQPALEIDALCDQRLAFLMHLGKLWRVFGSGWRRRVSGIRLQAHAMTGKIDLSWPINVTPPALHAGSIGPAVRDLQSKLHLAGFDPGPIDGRFGIRTHEAVLHFEAARNLPPLGTWGPEEIKLAA